MREMSVAELRYQAVLAVIGDGRKVTEAAATDPARNAALAGLCLSRLQPPPARSCQTICRNARSRGDGSTRYTGVYLDGQGRERSAGTFTSKRAAEHAAQTAAHAIEQGNWIDPTNGRIKFRDYVEQHWWPSRHLEPTTKASYRSYL